jgi:hypothetical protein
VKNKLACFILALAIIISLTPVVFANSAEPPGLTVLVTFPPDDLELSLRFDDGETAEAIPLRMERKAWEAYYRFHYYMDGRIERGSFENAVLVAQSSERSFECSMPDYSFGYYNNLITLNMTDETIAAGQTPGRTALLVAMRVCLTLIIEGLVFFLFRYRNKKSWILFIVVNLMTQTALNASITGPLDSPYWLIGYFFAEILIFAAEMLVFGLALPEHRKLRGVGCAFCANLLSLIIGSQIISNLPV